MQARRRPRVKTSELKVRIEPQLKRAAHKAARLEQRTLSSLVLKLLIDHCEEAGTLKKARRL
jgi:uncharacterized protein (DUF1778 family)